MRDKQHRQLAAAIYPFRPTGEQEPWVSAQGSFHWGRKRMLSDVVVPTLIGIALAVVVLLLFHFLLK